MEGEGGGNSIRTSFCSSQSVQMADYSFSSLTKGRGKEKRELENSWSWMKDRMSFLPGVIAKYSNLNKEISVDYSNLYQYIFSMSGVWSKKGQS